MNKISSPRPDLYKRDTLQEAIPVTGNAEIWCVAHLDAYLGIAEHLEALHQALSSAFAKGNISHRSIDEHIATARSKIDELIQAFWQQYIDQAASSALHARHLKSCGPPDKVDYEAVQGIPFLSWKSKMSSRQSNWRHLVIRIAEDSSGKDFVMVPPFRPTTLDDLPKGTHICPLNQPVHVATAALYEVLRAFLADIRRDITEISGKNSWIRMRCLVNFYTAVVNERLKEAHPEDFHGWQISMPKKIPINAAATIIAKHAANSSMIQTLAIRAIIDLLHDCMDNAEEAMCSSSDEMVMRVLTSLDKYDRDISETLEQLNRDLLANTDHVLSDYVCTLVSRPLPRGTPVLALIPKDSTASVVQLRAAT